jgi:hypothetical protein
VTTGQEGFWPQGSLWARFNPWGQELPRDWAYSTGQDFSAKHALPDVDFAVMHPWPNNWAELYGRLPASQDSCHQNLNKTRIFCLSPCQAECTQLLLVACDSMAAVQADAMHSRLTLVVSVLTAASRLTRDGIL